MTPQKIGRYEIKSELGRGGMATVFLAQDPLIGREVAIKVLPREFLHDPSFRQRFEREARTIAMLEHPAIVPIYDFGEDNGQPYIVMRYMKGGTLSDRLRSGPMAIKDATHVMERIGSALDRAHANGVVHRDLKPGNILFDEYNQAFLSDFGIVKVQDTATLTSGGIVGTPAYMSPEQVYGNRDIDGRSDIYTLGVILFEMLTGRVPFSGDNPTKLMMSHVMDPVPVIQKVNPALPPACNELIGRAMAKKPDERFSTASDLSEALKATSSSQASPFPRPSQAATVVEPLPSPIKSTTPPPSKVSSRPEPIPAPPIFTPPPTPAPSSATRYLLPTIGVVAILVLCCVASFIIVPLLAPNLNPFGDSKTTPTAITQNTPQASNTPGAQNPDTPSPDNNTATPKSPTATPDNSGANATATAIFATRIAEATANAQASPTATPPNFDNLIFDEDFNSEGNWGVGSTDGATGEVSDGSYTLSVTDSEGIFWTTAGEEFDDGIYELEATHLSGPVNNGFGMMFRVDDATDDFYLFEISSDGFVWIGWCGSGCSEVELLVGEGWFQSSAIRQGTFATNYLRLIAEGPNFIFYVNDIEVGRATDSRLQEGDIGLLVEALGDEGIIVISFDNFRITAQ